MRITVLGAGSWGTTVASVLTLVAILTLIAKSKLEQHLPTASSTPGTES